MSYVRTKTIGIKSAETDESLIAAEDEAERAARIEAAALLAETDRLLAAHEAKISAIRERRSALDSRFRLDERAQAEAKARERAEHINALKVSMLENEEARLGYLDEAQQHLRNFVAAINAALVVHEHTKVCARQLLGPNRRMLGAFPTDEFIRRIGGRIASTLTTMKLPGQKVVHRIGALDLPGASLFPPERSWSEHEQKLNANQISEFLEF